MTNGNNEIPSKLSGFIACPDISIMVGAISMLTFLYFPNNRGKVMSTTCYINLTTIIKTLNFNEDSFHTP